MMRKWMFVAILLVGLLVLSPADAQAAEEPSEGAGFVQPVEYETNVEANASAAGIDLEKLKETLFAGLQQCQQTVDISALKIPYTQSNVNLISDLIHDEMALCFHVNGFSYSYSSGKLVRITPVYRIESTQYWQMYDQVLSVADRLLQGIAGNSKLDDVQKALLIHDRLALLCEYDYNFETTSYTIYGALVTGKAACQGYAEAYDYLLEQVGIEGYLCESLALNHAWNIIYINGKSYHVDVTWDDYSWARGERGVVGLVEHSNFLLSSSGIYSAKHTANDYDNTPQDTTYDNYFWKNSNAAFLLIDDEIYYIDGESNQLKRYSDHEVLCAVQSRWGAGGNYFWKGNHARLSTDGKDLFYSLADAVYKYELSTGVQTKIFEPELGEEMEIYGFTYEDGFLICDINDGPAFSSVQYLYQIRESYQNGPVADANLKFMQAPSLSFQDYIGMQVLMTKKLANKYDKVYVEAVQVTPEGEVTTTLEPITYLTNYYVFDQQIMAWSMTETVTLTLYAEKDGQTYIGQTYTQSVESLALAMLQKYSTNTTICRMLVDMLNYGAAVQTQFKHNAENLPNTQLGDFAAMGSTNIPECDAANTKTGTATVKVINDSVSMQAKVEIQLVIKGAVTATPKATIGTTVLNPVLDTTSIKGYTVIRVAVGATQLRETVTIALYDENDAPVTQVYNVSVEGYAVTAITGSQKNVVIAMMRYGDSVTAYANK